MGTEAGQLVTRECVDKFLCVIDIFEVNEGVSDIALVSEVDRQVEKVVEPLVAMLVELVNQHLLVVLVRDITDHERGGVFDGGTCSHLQEKQGLIPNVDKIFILSHDVIEPRRKRM